MTVFSRTFRSTPHRDAAATWGAIADLLTRGQNPNAAAELRRVAGVATSVIADAAPREAPIVVTCDGPRTRIYCVYDEDALDESSAIENVLGFDPLEGDWHVSLPCQADDLDWVKRALSRMTPRVTARDVKDGIGVSETAAAAAATPLTLDAEALFK